MNPYDRETLNDFFGTVFGAAFVFLVSMAISLFVFDFNRDVAEIGAFVGMVFFLWRKLNSPLPKNNCD